MPTDDPSSPNPFQPIEFGPMTNTVALLRLDQEGLQWLATQLPQEHGITRLCWDVAKDVKRQLCLDEIGEE